MSDVSISKSTSQVKFDALGRQYTYNVASIKDKVSVIVSIYNKAKYLRACLDSIVNQTYHNLDIVLVDDASTDGSREIAKEYADKDTRIRLVSNESNKGVVFTRNRGLDMAEAEYITMVDGDDYLDLDAVAKMISAFYEYNIDWAVFGVKKIKHGKVFIASRASESKFYMVRDPQFFEDLRTSNELYACYAKMYKKSKIKQNFQDYLLDDFPFNLKYMENIESAYLSSDMVYNYVKLSDDECLSGRLKDDNIGYYKEASDEMSSVVERLYPKNKRAYYLAAGFVLTALFANFIAMHEAGESKENIQARISMDLEDERILEAVSSMVANTPKEEAFNQSLLDKDVDYIYDTYMEEYNNMTTQRVLDEHSLSLSLLESQSSPQSQQHQFIEQPKPYVAVGHGG